MRAPRCSTCGRRRIPVAIGTARNWWARLRPALLAAAGLLLVVVTAADALVTALLGITPLTLRARAVARWATDRYRMAGSDVIDAEVISDEFTHPRGRL